MKKKKILFLGCGKMGLAMAKNLAVNNEYSNQIHAIDPLANFDIEGIDLKKSLDDLPQNYTADFVFVSVKPQIAKDVILSAIKSGKFAKNTVYISILAGKKIKFFKELIGKSVKIIRTMPNLPILENEGVFAYLFSKNIRPRDRENARLLFQSFGEIIELDKEKKFDRFTAIFGSGPAYIFHLQEVLLKETLKLGINSEISKKMVEKLLFGSSLMATNSDLDFTELKKSVTSKEGTTDAGLKALSKNSALEKLIAKTIKSAIKRSKELSK